MSYNSTGEEQMAELKEFLKKFWKLILVILIVGLAAVWGWRYWQTHQSEQMEKASDSYESLIAKLDPAQPESIKELVTFAQENNNTYGVFSYLKAAQYYVETLKDYAGAQALLESAAKQTDEEAILSIINIRIARLQYQQELLEESLTTLAKVTETSWSPVVNDIRGDVLVALARYTEACQAYEVALASQPTPELETNIKMKLNEAQYLKAKQDIEDQKQAAEAEKEAARVAAEDAKQLAEEQRLQEQQSQSEQP